MQVKKGLKNIVYSIGGQMITMIIGILIPRLVIISYGSEINGLLSSISSVMAYLALLEAGLGSVTCQALYKPIASDDKGQINKILAAASYNYKRTGIIYIIALSVIAVIYPFVIKGDLNSFLVIALVILCGAPNVINYLFQRKYLTLLEAVGDHYIMSNVQTVLNIVASLSKVVLLKCGYNVIVVQAIYSLVSLAQMIYIYAYIKKKYSWVNLNCEKDFSGFKQQKGALLHQVCSLITNSTDTIILTFFCSLQIVSIYGMYNMLYNIIYNAIYTVNSSLVFILGQSFQKGEEYYKKVIDAYETLYITLASALLLVTYIMIIPFLKLYTAGADINYIDAWLPILFLMIKMLNSIRNASINTITVSGHFNDTAKHAIIEAAINLIVSVVSVSFIGMPGVLVGTVLAFAYRCVVAIRFANKKILRRNCKHSIRTSLINILLVVIGVCVSNEISYPIDNYLKLIFVAGIVAAVVLLIFAVINSIADRETVKMIIAFLKSKISQRKQKE